MTKKIFSKKIVKQSIKNNWVIFASLTGVLSFFITIMTIMGAQMIESDANMGIVYPIHPLLMMYANGIFGSLGIIILIIFTIIVGNKLIASEIDRGTLSYTLNTPITRKQIVISKLLFYILAIACIGIVVGLFGMASIAIAGTNVPLDTFWTLILGFTLYGFAIGGICFFASCWFNKSSNASALSSGLSIAFFVLNSLVAIDGLEWLKYFTLNTLYDSTAIINSDGFIVQLVMLFVIGSVLYFIGINKFLKKDLPL